MELISLLPILASTVAVTIVWRDEASRRQLMNALQIQETMLKQRLEQREEVLKEMLSVREFKLKETLKAREEELKEALEKIAVSHNNLHSRCQELGDSVGELTTKTSAIISQLSSGVRR